jgi:hypothetical protein
MVSFKMICDFGANHSPVGQVILSSGIYFALRKIQLAIPFVGIKAFPHGESFLRTIDFR